MENKKGEENPLDKAAVTGLVALISPLLKIKSLKVSVDFAGFTLDLKSKEPPSPAKEPPSPATE